MRRAAIVACSRTPVGRYRGALRHVRPDDMAALVIAKVLERTGVDPAMVDDVYFGCANQAGEDNRNVARMALLLAGLPPSVPGCTVNRLCASGLDAINIAARCIETGTGDVYVAGGVESMTRAPLVMGKAIEEFPRGTPEIYDTTIGWRFANPKLAAMYDPYSMGETAENVARKYRLSRQEQDEFALASQRKYAAALDAGRWDDEIIPVTIPQRKGEAIIVDRDEHPRPDTNMEKLAKLPPAFAKDGTVTAGNSSGINDGAGAVMLVEQRRAKELGLEVLALVGPSATAGVDPAYMGLGPVPATRRLLARTGHKLDDFDIIELNEAFAAQSLACIRDLGIDTGRLNPNGGAIAIGHPLGCTGARLVTTIVHQLKRRSLSRGLVTLCVGVGQGVSTVIERPN